MPHSQTAPVTGRTGPGVPVTVWPAIPAFTGGEQAGAVITAAVITAFTRPGDLITAGLPGAARAAAAAGRHLTPLPDPDPPGCPVRPPLPPRAGHVALAVITAPRPGTGGTATYGACEQLLRPGGILAVLTGPAPGESGAVVAAARAAGLAYAQHIVLLHAAIDGDRLTPLSPAPGPCQDTAGARAHTDLHVFSKTGSCS